MVGGMTSKLSTPGIPTTMIGAFGPVLSMLAMMRLEGSQWLHPSLMSWALVGVSVLWCPFLPTSVSAIILGQWRDAAAPGVRGLARFGAVARDLMAGPTRQAVVLNTASWAVTAAVAAMSFAK
jgi:hypothetical protein